MSVTTDEGQRIIDAEIAAARAADPPPRNVNPDDDTEPKKRGRPVGSKNGTSSGRRSRSSKLDEIEAAFATTVDRGAKLAAYVVTMSPIAPERKALWIEDTIIINSEDGTKALTGSLRYACEKNARIERFCLRAIEASAYTGIGAAVLFGLVIPIAMNHGLIKVPDSLRAMMPTTPPVYEPTGEQQAEEMRTAGI